MRIWIFGLQTLKAEFFLLNQAFIGIPMITDKSYFLPWSSAQWPSDSPAVVLLRISEFVQPLNLKTLNVMARPGPCLWPLRSSTHVVHDDWSQDGSSCAFSRAGFRIHSTWHLSWSLLDPCRNQISLGEGLERRQAPRSPSPALKYVHGMWVGDEGNVEAPPFPCRQPFPAVILSFSWGLGWVPRQHLLLLFSGEGHQHMGVGEFLYWPWASTRGCGSCEADGQSRKVSLSFHSSCLLFFVPSCHLFFASAHFLSSLLSPHPCTGPCLFHHHWTW